MLINLPKLTSLYANLAKHSAYPSPNMYRDRFICNCSVDEFIKADGENFLEDGKLPNLGKFYSEAHLADYFNHVIALFYLFMKDKFKPRGYWTAERCSKLLRVGAKPDVMLVPVQEGYKFPVDQVIWPMVYAVAEKTTPGHPTRKSEDISASKAFMTMYTQGDRCCAPTLTINAHDFSIHIFNRAGRISYMNLDYKSQKHTAIFVNFLLLISYEQWSFDLTMTRRQTLFNDQFDEFPPRLTGQQKKFQFKYTELDNVNAPLTSFPTTSIVATDFGDIFDLDSDDLDSDDSDSDSPLQLGLSKAKLEANLMCIIDTIVCDGQRFQVEAELFRSQSLIGRGTRVWQARNREGETVIIKESWIFEQEQIEADFIKNADDRQKQIPRIIKHQEFKNISTARFCQIEHKGPHREKRRVVMTPACVPVLNVQSPVEVLGLFLDYTLAIRYLKQKNRMHRDISSTNLMISSASTMTWGVDPIIEELGESADLVFVNKLLSALLFLQSNSCRRGVLIDYDYATFIDKEMEDPFLTNTLVEHSAPTGSGKHKDHSGPDKRMGTMAFMAIPVLFAPCQHRVAYDLESLFYAFVYILTHVNFKQNPGERPLRSSCKAVTTWFTQSSFSDLCAHKSGQFHFYMESCIIPNLQKDFAHFASYLRELWLGLYPHPQIVPVLNDGSETPPAVLEPTDCNDKFIETFVKAILIEKERMAASEQDSTPARKRVKISESTMKTTMK